MTHTLFVMGLALLILPAVVGIAQVQKPGSGDPPQVEITNGPLRAKVYLPDAQNGFYRGTRFDWSGVVATLAYAGHNYYGPWVARLEPQVYDFEFRGAEIIGSPCSSAVGPVDEFKNGTSAVGFDEAKIGGTFIKIGVGVLRKQGAKYDPYTLYDIVDHGKWTVKTHADSVEFTQELADPASGYGYIYHKTVRLVAGKPQMVLEHRLKNTGRRALEGSVYNHNFLVLDGQTVGPDFSVAFPFPIHSPEPPSPQLAELRGKNFVYLKELTGKDVAAAPLEGFGGTAGDNEVRIENRRQGAGMLIRGNRPLASLYLWSIRSVLAVEPYVAYSIEPGQEFDWNVTYDYYTLGAAK